MANTSLNTKKRNVLYNNISNRTSTSSSPTTQTIILALSIIFVIAVLIGAGRWMWTYYNDEQKVEVSTFTLLDGANRGDNEFEISSSQMPPSTFSNEYALSFWIYVDDYNYRRDQNKYILRRGTIATDGAVNPEVILHPFHNTLEVSIQLQTDKSPSRASQEHHPECGKSTPSSAESFANILESVHPSKPLNNNYFAVMDGREVLPNPDAGKKLGYKLAKVHIESNERFEDAGSAEPAATNSSPAAAANSVVDEESGECDCKCNGDEYVPMTRDEWKKKTASCQVPDFPLQKWVHVVISQYNQVLDLYVDGHLASSCPMPGFPAISTDGLVLCPEDGFSGRISRVTYSNTSLSASDVQSVYMKGPDSSHNPKNSNTRVYIVMGVILGVFLIMAFLLYKFI